MWTTLRHSSRVLKRYSCTNQPPLYLFLMYWQRSLTTTTTTTTSLTTTNRRTDDSEYRHATDASANNLECSTPTKEDVPNQCPPQETNDNIPMMDQSDLCNVPKVIVVDDGEDENDDWYLSPFLHQNDVHDSGKLKMYNNAHDTSAAPAATLSNLQNWRDVNNATKQFCESVQHAIKTVNVRNNRKKHGRLAHLRVVFRCYGVNLGRNGQLEWIAVGFEPPVVHAPVLYIVDVAEKRQVKTKHPKDQIRDLPFTSSCWVPPSPYKIKRIAALRDLFFNPRILKVAHDCRRDSDALHYKIGVTLENIHDTYCFHQIMHHRIKNNNGDQLSSYTSIKTLLQRNGFLAEHVPTDEESFYENHPADYWRTRPLTEDMRQQVLAETFPLFPIAARQKFWLKQSDNSEYRAARLMSRLFNFEFRGRKNIILKCRKSDEEIKMDMKFIERKADAFLFKVHDGNPQRRWSVYYKSLQDLQAVSSEFTK